MLNFIYPFIHAWHPICSGAKLIVRKIQCCLQCFNSLILGYHCLYLVPFLKSCRQQSNIWTLPKSVVWNKKKYQSFLITNFFWPQQQKYNKFLQLKKSMRKRQISWYNYIPLTIGRTGWRPLECQSLSLSFRLPQHWLL